MQSAPPEPGQRVRGTRHQQHYQRAQALAAGAEDLVCRRQQHGVPFAHHVEQVLPADVHVGRHGRHHLLHRHGRVAQPRHAAAGGRVLCRRRRRRRGGLRRHRRDAQRRRCRAARHAPQLIGAAFPRAQRLGARWTLPVAAAAASGRSAAPHRALPRHCCGLYGHCRAVLQRRERHSAVCGAPLGGCGLRGPCSAALPSQVPDSQPASMSHVPAGRLWPGPALHWAPCRPSSEWAPRAGQAPFVEC